MKKLAVLGHPIGHTLSPVMHNASIKALGLEAEYEYGKLDVPPGELLARLRVALRHRLQREGAAPIVRSGGLEIDLVKRLGFRREGNRSGEPDLRVVKSLGTL